jgi:hypothetical protein
MPVQTIAKSATQLRVGIQSLTYTANEVFRHAYTIAQKRALDTGEISRNKDVLTSAFHTWLATQTLQELQMEVVDPQGTLVEKWTWAFRYADDPDAENTSPIDKVEDALGKLKPLTTGCKVRFVVRLKPGAPAVRGWYDATPANDAHLTTLVVGEIQTKKITTLVGCMTQKPE